MREGDHCLEDTDGMYTLENDLLKETEEYF